MTPDLLPSVPSDPFESSHALRYRKKNNSYILYSIGPDGADDGGKSIDELDPTYPQSRHNVSSDSKGDIVAGVNP
ncbi:MAG: hypothetical protein ABIY70_04470 [Capsulimonas sp.]|uniref:hypothetical protein n=1 Tax=Capsulimonas sp. TaxID=2494211 RepID=UPI003263FF55